MANCYALTSVLQFVAAGARALARSRYAGYEELFLRAPLVFLAVRERAAPDRAVVPRLAVGARFAVVARFAVLPRFAVVPRFAVAARFAVVFLALLGRLLVALAARLLRVAAAFFAALDRLALDRFSWLFFPPSLAGVVSTGLPRPDPLFFPPPVILLTVAHARASAVFFETPRFS